MRRPVHRLGRLVQQQRQERVAIKGDYFASESEARAARDGAQTRWVRTPNSPQVQQRRQQVDALYELIGGYALTKPRHRDQQRHACHLLVQGVLGPTPMPSQ